jgi:hypothetical protein
MVMSWVLEMDLCFATILLALLFQCYIMIGRILW